MIYENFVHTEKRFPFKFVIDERKKLGDISFDNCMKVCYDLTVRDLVDIMTKGDAVYDELIEKSDFKFYTFNGLDELFFLELCDGGKEFLQYNMEFFSSEKVDKFKNVCSLYFERISDKK